MNLTASQVNKGSPDAAAALKTEGASAETARVSALAAAFADDPTFLQAAIADPKMTVDSAKAKKFDELKAANATLAAENTQLKAKATEGVVGFAPSDKPGGPISQATSDALAAEALAIWNANEGIRMEFGGEQSAMIADFKRNPGSYRPKK